MDGTQATAKAPEVKRARLFGELLVSKGLLSPEELEQVLDEQRKSGGRLGENLLRLERLNDEDVTLALAEHLSMEYIRLNDIDKVDLDVARMLPEGLAKRFCLVAIGEVDDEVVIVMADPLDVVAIDTVTLKIKRQARLAISSPREIRRAIELIYHGSDVEENQLRSLVEGEVDEIEEGEIKDDILDEEDDESDISGESEANKAPVIRFVNLLLSQAVKSRASDIHIEPQEKNPVVRMRIDGVLRDMVPPAKKMQAAVVARIKIIARMDIAERRLPQDGRFKVKISGRAVEVRVSVIPTIYGEKVVMRILDASAVKHDITCLGLEPELLEEFKGMLTRPHGIMIVTGPTGSGKSTTLYS
ncbi:MAG: GspE/PulE family protein, partial [Planctomycetota bacterium]